MISLETKRSGGKGMHAFRYEGREQLQDWNLGGKNLNQAGKLENLKKKIQKNAVFFVGVSKARWKGQDGKEVVIKRYVIPEAKVLIEGYQ
jgi:hypothetical protein